LTTAILLALSVAMAAASWLLFVWSIHKVEKHYKKSAKDKSKEE
jgi:hypothetical protein